LGDYVKHTHDEEPRERGHHHHHSSDRRTGRHHRRGGRASRGDVRAAVLQLLAEEPMHGYQLMQAIADRTGGRWTPSPGAIYPTINQLEDEGLVTVEADSGRKLVSLTDAGREQLSADSSAGREPFADFESDAPEADLRRLVGELHSAVRQVGRSGNTEQRAAAAKILAETRKSIYLLLADESGR
jgi:DNA-binding PadR family transcriptional regulator